MNLAGHSIIPVRTNIRNSLNRVLIVLVFMFIAGVTAFAAPDIFRSLSMGDTWDPLLLFSCKPALLRALGGLAAGLALALAGLYLLDPGRMVLLTRFFLLTFIVLLIILWLSLT